MDDYPTIKILPGEDRRLRAGSPWIYSNELRMDESAKAIPPGKLQEAMRLFATPPLGEYFRVVRAD